MNLLLAATGHDATGIVEANSLPKKALPPLSDSQDTRVSTFPSQVEETSDALVLGATMGSLGRARRVPLSDGRNNGRINSTHERADQKEGQDVEA